MSESPATEASPPECSATQPSSSEPSSPEVAPPESSPESSPPETPLPTSPSPLYREAVIDGKGIGLVAISAIPRGTVILHEQPLFTHEHQNKLLGPAFSSLCVSKVNSLCAADRKSFFRLTSGFESKSFSEDVLGRVILNSIPFSDESHGIFATIPRINHSCRPNVISLEGASDYSLSVRALVDIAPGTELTRSYLGDLAGSWHFVDRKLLSPHRKRQELLQALFQFRCRCVACTLPEPDQKASDDRRVRVRDILDRATGDLTAAEPAALLKHFREEADLLIAEGLVLELVCSYQKCCTVCIMHGDVARAKAFARIARRRKDVVTGEEPPGVAELMPQKLPYFKHVSSQWRTRGGSLPEEGDPGFEKWLWRRTEKWAGIPGVVYVTDRPFKRRAAADMGV